MAEIDPQQEARAPEVPQWMTWLGVAVVVAIVLLCSGVFTGGSDEPSDEANAFDAERVCKDEFIPKRLKAPASAEYNLDVTGGPTTYTVSGTVDSQNSFGAMIRNDVTCIVEVADEERWRLVSVTGLDR